MRNNHISIFFGLLTVLMLTSIVLVVNLQEVSIAEDVTTINTLGTEDQPMLSLDGNTLFFLYSPMDFEWFQELSHQEKIKILKKEKGIKIIGPYRKGHTEDDILNKNIWFRGYCSEKVNRRWTEPRLAPHELIPRDRGIYAKFMIVNNGNTLIVEASGIYINGKEIKGNGDFVVFYKQADLTWKGPFVLSEYFNTPYMEQDFHVTEDAKTLIFRSDRPGTLGFGDIFISNFEKEEWSEPTNIGKPINTEDAFEAPGWLSPDKQRIYFVRVYPQPRNFQKTGIYLSEKLNERWTEPIKLDLGIDVRKIFAPSLTRDEKELYFEILPQGRKDYQIYVSHKQSDMSWSIAVPIDVD